MPRAPFTVNMLLMLSMVELRHVTALHPLMEKYYLIEELLEPPISFPLAVLDLRLFKVATLSFLVNEPPYV